MDVIQGLNNTRYSLSPLRLVCLKVKWGSCDITPVPLDFDTKSFMYYVRSVDPYNDFMTKSSRTHSGL